jgi:sRNA-binding carbon storage regulator CsrA
MSRKVKTLHTTVHIGDRVQIGDSIITIGDKSGRRVRLGVESRHRVTIFQNDKPLAQECLTETSTGGNHGTDHHHHKRTAN